MGSSALWVLGYSMSSWFSLVGVLLRRNRMLEKRDEAVRATRLRPRFRQCTSDVTGTSAKRALSRDTRMTLSLFSMSFTIFKISCLSVCRVIPRILSMAETCFLLQDTRKIYSLLSYVWGIVILTITVQRHNLIYCISQTVIWFHGEWSVLKLYWNRPSSSEFLFTCFVCLKVQAYFFQKTIFLFS